MTVSGVGASPWLRSALPVDPIGFVSSLRRVADTNSTLAVWESRGFRDFMAARFTAEPSFGWFLAVANDLIDDLADDLAEDLVWMSGKEEGCEVASASTP